MSDTDLLRDAARALSHHGHLGCHDWFVVVTSDEPIVCGAAVEEYLRFNEAVEVAVGYAANDAEFERLSTENAALRAEVERLTPREMEPREACDVLNKHRYLTCETWQPRKHDNALICGQSCHCVLRGPGFLYIAQGLERDAKGGG